MATRLSVLVVDDSENWLDMLRFILEDEGYDVRVATTVEEASILLASHDFSLAIVDIRLNEGDAEDIQGFEVLGQIKRTDMNVPVIVLTSHGTIPLVRKAFKEFGVIDFLEKQALDSQELRNLAQVAKASAREWPVR